MSGALEEVRAAIGDAGGLLRFDEYVRLALYGEHGFYNAGGRAGRRGGHFLTSPEVGPLFGAVLARAIDGWWHRLGEPGDFAIVEAGAGPGTLARAILAAEPECAPRYVTVEVSAAQRAEHPADVEALAGLTSLPAGVTGVVVANELLDNLPFRLAVHDGGWREAYVADGGDGTLREVLAAPLDPLPAWLPASASHGARAPIQDEAAAWVRAALGTLDRGRVLAVDYAVARTAELTLRPWREWLRTFRGHDRGGHYLADPGTQDVTVEVCLDQLPPPDAVRTQHQFLALHGIDELVEAGRAEWAKAAAAPSLRALMMRSRIREAEALTDPDGLGGFLAVEWEVPSGHDDR
ncbi:MAG: SAM-dependent methyltransferase [Ilumatobacteraceae bacterium]